ncbi:TatD family hydrolase [Bacteriovorax sp. Seq25_V]|uniref:TatD family hydrolase n=1 Tax=Bacteriovorax sp. Seq25_V TaxID=1201288 RepID=UPI00038A0113|nr:TatD family hydrolase [Bacteriovorax sp. Seq25_V]EQC45459.1 hydrolase, TatD family [Bacteriovorax sp. Seq25_V]
MSDKKSKDIPKFPVGLIETHCHLDYLKDLSTEEIVSKSNEYHVEKIITIAVSPDNLDTVIELTREHDCVYGTQGIHPHDAKFFSKEVLQKVESNLNEPKIVAVGEIGLDYHYNKSPKEIQIEAFESFLQLASDKDLPVVIHTRDADEDTKNTLLKFSAKLKRKGVIHSFTSSIELAQFCLDQGFHLGFNGIITFKNAENVRDVLRITPLERILIETDAPFLTPIPYRGKENAPFYLPFIAKAIAEIKDVPVEEILRITKENANQVFGFQK